jgi:hypothetical protein
MLLTPILQDYFFTYEHLTWTRKNFQYKKWQGYQEQTETLL